MASFHFVMGGGDGHRGGETPLPREIMNWGRAQ